MGEFLVKYPCCRWESANGGTAADISKLAQNLDLYYYQRSGRIIVFPLKPVACRLRGGKQLLFVLGEICGKGLFEVWVPPTEGWPVLREVLHRPGHSEVVRGSIHIIIRA